MPMRMPLSPLLIARYYYACCRFARFAYRYAAAATFLPSPLFAPAFRLAAPHFFQPGCARAAFAMSIQTRRYAATPLLMSRHRCRRRCRTLPLTSTAKVTRHGAIVIVSPRSPRYILQCHGMPVMSCYRQAPSAFCREEARHDAVAQDMRHEMRCFVDAQPFYDYSADGVIFCSYCAPPHYRHRYGAMPRRHCF